MGLLETRDCVEGEIDEALTCLNVIVSDTRFA